MNLILDWLDRKKAVRTAKSVPWRLLEAVYDLVTLNSMKNVGLCIPVIERYA